MSTTPSTNMSLPIPGVGNEAGPQWAIDLNNCFNILDAHDHSSGSGVMITPSGININAPLTFANNNLTNAKILGMFLQTVDPSTLGALYYKGVDLYFNDGSGNHIQITASGSVSGATGTITGLPSGTASASYQAGSGTFVFQSATNTGADIDGRSFILRNAAASSKSLTLSPPAAMGADIAQTLPVIPASTQVMTMDSGGAMGTTTYDAIAAGFTTTGTGSIVSTASAANANTLVAKVTRATGTTVGAGGVAISTSCGSFSTTSSSYVDVTNLSITITISGRPVSVFLSTDGTGASGPGEFAANNTGANPAVEARLAILRDGTNISENVLNLNLGATSSGPQIIVPVGSVACLDNPGAGTYTYKVQAKVAGTGSRALVTFAKLVAYEL